MDRKRVIIPIEVDLDPVLGEFHTKESAEYNIQRILNDAIAHYNPKVVTGIPTAGIPPEALAMMQRTMAGGPMALLASLQEMLAIPEIAQSMTEATNAMAQELERAGQNESVPDHYEEPHTSWCEGCDTTADGRPACRVHEEKNP